MGFVKIGNDIESQKSIRQQRSFNKEIQKLQRENSERANTTIVQLVGVGESATKKKKKAQKTKD